MENAENSKVIIIENKYKVTKEIYKTWAKENKRVKYFRIFWIFVAAVLLASICCYVIANQIQEVVVPATLMIFCLYRAFLWNKILLDKQYDALVKLYKKQDWERRIIFYDENIEVNDEDINIMKFQYGDIVSIERINDYMKIQMQKGILRIYENAFTKANMDECEKLINEKIK